MVSTKLRAILLTSGPDVLVKRASVVAHESFEILGEWRFSRQDKVLPPEIVKVVEENQIDYLLNFLSPIILKANLLSKIQRASINFHPGTPEYPGVGCASLALYEGAKFFGSTAHIITETVDGGPILRVSPFAIDSAWHCGELFDRALQQCLTLFEDYVTDLKYGLSPQPSGEKWTRKAMTRKQFEQWMTLPENADAEQVAKMILACRHPKFPGPYQLRGNERICLSDNLSH
jgi:methionyl-tRNA formyltransferase